MTKEVPRTSVLRDEELSISDATLIARLQNSKGWPTLGNAAADRIELLATTNEQLVATNEALSISNATLIAELATCEKYRDAYAEMGRIGTQAVRDLEAKLAENEVRLGKAVEALTNIDALDPESLVGGCSRDALSGLVNRMGDKARAALAEIKSHSDEFATQKGESHE